MNYETILELLREKKFTALKEAMKDMQVADIAEFIDELSGKEAILVFRLLPKEKAVDVFAYLSISQQTTLSELVNEGEMAGILEDLSFDDKIDFLEEMPANVVKRILKNTTETERKLINQFLNYPDNSAGSLMTIEFMDLKKEMTVGEALERIRHVALDKETIYTCYVVDSQHKLEGVISLRSLVLSDTEVQIKDIMKTDVVQVHTHEDQEEIAEVFKKYNILVLPVVDQEDRLVGIITVDDIIDVIDEENTEDFHRMAAIQPLEEEYLEAGIFTLAKKRFLWLLVLMISATFTGYIIRRYELALESVVALAAFIPMLMDTGGNAGAQSSTLVIRGLALGEVEFSDTLKVIWREFQVSILVAIGLVGVNFVRIFYFEQYSFSIALTVTLTLFLTIIVAKMIGGVLPIMASRCNLDPAIMASPLITTIVDTIALIVYFSLAVWILGINL